MKCQLKKDKLYKVGNTVPIYFWKLNLQCSNVTFGWKWSFLVFVGAEPVISLSSQGLAQRCDNNIYPLLWLYPLTILYILCCSLLWFVCFCCFFFSFLFLIKHFDRSRILRPPPVYRHIKRKKENIQDVIYLLKARHIPLKACQEDISWEAGKGLGQCLSFSVVVLLRLFAGCWEHVHRGQAKGPPFC